MTTKVAPKGKNYSPDGQKVLQQIGSNISKKRQEASFSQEKLAVLTGLHRTTIGEIERGEQNVTCLNMAKIAGALGCQLVELIDSVNPIQPSANNLKYNTNQKIDQVLEEHRRKFTRN